MVNIYRVKFYYLFLREENWAHSFGVQLIEHVKFQCNNQIIC